MHQINSLENQSSYQIIHSMTVWRLQSIIILTYFSFEKEFVLFLSYVQVNESITLMISIWNFKCNSSCFFQMLN